jgi:hypothetical protein
MLQQHESHKKTGGDGVLGVWVVSIDIEKRKHDRE